MCKYRVDANGVGCTYRRVTVALVKYVFLILISSDEVIYAQSPKPFCSTIGAQKDAHMSE